MSPRPCGRKETADREAREPVPHRRRKDAAGKPPSRVGGLVRGLTGSLAAGLLVLAVTLLGVQLWATNSGLPGPGAGVVIGHLVASVVALVAQAVADRRRGLAGGLSAAVVLAVVLGALWYWWWF
ncbi:hypothetical protein DFQ14_10872 [Halopolyspora algeriensis]|uniref:Uncharacterized protein n=1 Tax=Halopolyspora algeriensis TaxID=1500506 RepID=A0A368VS70_9ACTN|nr:hypothetical protein DFQ14_10872 [Halopolyspora algeriensis]TQM56714.1 hypothetical protein FHU43_1528 [Halopolyspora algeriensis]